MVPIIFKKYNHLIIAIFSGFFTFCLYPEIFWIISNFYLYFSYFCPFWNFLPVFTCSCLFLPIFPCFCQFLGIFGHSCLFGHFFAILAIVSHLYPFNIFLLVLAFFLLFFASFWLFLVVFVCWLFFFIFRYCCPTLPWLNFFVSLCKFLHDFNIFCTFQPIFHFFQLCKIVTSFHLFQSFFNPLLPFDYSHWIMNQQKLKGNWVYQCHFEAPWQ